MTNPFFNNTTTLVAFTRARAENVESKFTLVATGFDTVNTTFALKGTIAGQVWTGVHDFTGATLTAATQTAGDSSTKVATTAFVAATAFSSVLPAQTGNSGKYLTTDGTSASWGSNLSPSVGGTGVTSYAIGDTLYASGATALSKLAAVATGNVLISGGVTTAPSWGKVGLATHVSGVLDPANGGSGVANNTTATTTRSGNFGMTITLTGTTSVTFPTAGTLATLNGSETFTNKVLTSPNINAVTNLTSNGLVGTSGGAGALSTTTLGAGFTYSGTTLSFTGASAAPTGLSPALLAQTSGTLTLPDLTTLPGPAHLICPSNQAAIPTTIQTSDSWTISKTFVAGTLDVISALHAFTAHGSWGSTTLTPPVLNTETITINANAVVGVAQLDTNLFVVVHTSVAANIFATAVDASGNTLGAPVSLGAVSSSGTPVAVYKVSTTSFIVSWSSTASVQTLIAGSVSGTTITPGSAVTTTGVGLTRLIQLSSTLYVQTLSNANDLQAFSVSGTTVTPGTAVASGAVGTGLGFIQAAPVSATTFLTTYLATGGGSSTTRALTARVGSISGTTITLNTAVAGTNIENSSSGIAVLRAFAAGGPYVVVSQNGAASTSGDFYGITVSGTTTTLGTVTTRATDLPVASRGLPTLTVTTGDATTAYNATTMLFGHLSAGPYAATISGTTLVFGSATTLSGASTKVFMTDFAGTNYYAVGGGVMDKITVSGTTITSTDAYTAAAPTFIATDGVHDKAAKYSGTWYAWTLPTPKAGINGTKWLFSPTTTTFTLNGPVA